MKKSVAMATYNGEKYIIEQLDSIRRQTVKVDEVRIRDDKSVDNTVSLVNEYIKKHDLSPAWSIEVNEKNKGYASNFMTAVSETDGELIFFCDQDDIWFSDRIERMEKILEENDKIMLLGSEFEAFSDSGDALKIPGWEKKMMRHDNSVEKMEFTSNNIFIGCQGCTMAMRRELLDKALPYWYKGWAHDEFVWKMALCLDGLYMYHGDTLKRRCHANNASLNKMHNIDTRLKYTKNLLFSHKQTLEFAKSIGLDKRKIELLEKHIKATKLRIDLLESKRMSNAFPLAVKYNDCYHKKRAILTEIVIAVKYSANME